MSLLKSRWIVITGGAALAVAMPAFLLRASGAAVPLPLPLTVTPLQISVPASLGLALSAPPFSPTRAPSDVVEPAPDADVAASPIVSMQPLPKLVGVVIHGGGRGVALIQGSDGATVTLTRGEDVDGWRLTALRPAEATFEQAGDRQVARLDFSNKNDTQSPARADRASASDSPATPDKQE